MIGLLGGEAAGVHVAGHIPSGLPQLTPPNLDATTWYELAPGALAIVLVGYAEALGAAKAAAIQSGGDINPNQELIAHGPANILSGLFGGFLVVGSLSKTSVATAAGARSQVANLVAAIFCLFTLIWLTSLFRNMPQPALAAIVIAAMLHLTKPKYLQDLFVRSSLSFANAMIVIAAELTLGVLHGIALGVVLSVLNLIYRTSHPHGAILGQLPETEAYRNVQRHPEVITFPGLLIWRIGGDLFFASIGHVRETLQASLDARPEVQRVLLDFGPVNFIDVTASDELLSLIKELKNQGITVAFARVRDVVRDDMRLARIEATVGPSNFYERINRRGACLAAVLRSIRPAIAQDLPTFASRSMFVLGNWLRDDRCRHNQLKTSFGRKATQCPFWVKSTFPRVRPMSALLPIADMCGALVHIRFVPIADIALRSILLNVALPCPFGP